MAVRNNESNMAQKKDGNAEKSPESKYKSVYFYAAVLIIFFVWAFINNHNTSQVTITQTPAKNNISPTSAPITHGPAFNVNVSIINTICAIEGKVDFSVIQMIIKGSVPPYDLTITNSLGQVSGPILIMNENEKIEVKVYGGDYFTAVIRSTINEFWSGTIGMPIEAELCRAHSTLPPISTENIATVIIMETMTPSATLLAGQSPTQTERVGEGKTRSPKITLTVNTIHPQSTTAIPLATTAIPRVTTAGPQATTAVPQATTAVPQATTVPPPTIAPTVINPNPRECDDGIDNDQDGYTDYPADSDCKKFSDPKEGKS